MDVLTPEQRQRNMRAIRAKNTKPEMLLRRGLHAAGFRFRLHVSDLPGHPDIVLPRYRTAIQVHGCFWHGHNCPLFKLPTTRPDFWAEKIAGNQARDQRTADSLRNAGWRVLTIWECSLKGPARRPVQEVLERCAAFIKSDVKQADLEGRWTSQQRGRPRSANS